MTALHPDRSGTRRTAPTTALLTAGALAGPLYVVSGALQAALRPGFDIRRHPISVLSNGELGWIQVATFLLAGALTVAGAVGVHRALPGGWAPRLLAVYGLGLVGAGIFRADPLPGFPPGSAGSEVSWHGTAHLASGALGFLGFVGACLVIGRRYARQGRGGRAVWSRVTGVAFLAAFVGIAASGGQPVLNLAFTAAVLAGWVWLTATELDLR
jgi:hypothetical membrane protein